MIMFTPKEIARIGLFTALCAATALLVRFGSALVPFSLVPFAAVLAGSTLGPRLGAISVLVYIALGLLGLPIFASAPYGGPLYVLNPTFGYLPGMALAAYLAGYILKQQIPWRLPLAAVAATLALYLLGLPHLAWIMAKVVHKPLGFRGVLLAGMLPFLIGDFLKAFAAVYLGELVQRRIEGGGA
jgi:biotin transport system substrate-specific component